MSFTFGHTHPGIGGTKSLPLEDCVCSIPGGRLGINHARMCVCPKVKDMGPFSASSERNESEDVIQNAC